MKYHTFFEKSKDVAKFVFCCSLDWRLSGSTSVLFTDDDDGTGYHRMDAMGYQRMAAIVV